MQYWRIVNYSPLAVACKKKENIGRVINLFMQHFIYWTFKYLKSCFLWLNSSY
ncbi:hypothetical protein [uncultured Methanobrevibacter sp.]|uniref:hypothetical protein n=1 Tax=uncultured Methanobrevibacter sp. TaxID=253161 RepID=UPI0025F2875F|nr:hypothetical protein [uncultured Methanobrevibacter sp.]